MKGDGFAVRLACFYAALYLVVGTQLPFFPVWLKASGLEAAQIGLVLALPTLVRLAAVPIITRAADRHDAVRRAIIVCASASTAACLALGLSAQLATIALFTAILALVQTPLIPLADAYAVRGLAARGRAYGPVRMWGSVSFIVANLGVGLLLDVVPAAAIIWILAGSLALLAAVSLALHPDRSGGPARAATPGGFRLLLGQPALVAVIAASSLVQASHALYYGFSVLAWSAAGLSGGAIGALWAVGVLAEIALFAASARFPAAGTSLLLVGGAGALLRWTLMAFDPPAAALPLVQCLHALSFGATYLGAVQFLARAAPPHLAATAQGLLSTATATVTVAALAGAGTLYGAFADRAYLLMAAMALAGLACAFWARRTRADAS